METQIQEQRPMFRTSKKTKTNLTVELVRITPQIAKNYLRYSVKNRKISIKNLQFLKNEMENDRFLENGEAIIFDINGDLKDGNHRLKAIVKSGKSYFIPIVRGVQTSCMPTYDTGKNRSAADVLSLNGFKYCTNIAALIILIDGYTIRKYKLASQKSVNRGYKLTNQQVLEYCQDNYHWLKNIVSSCSNISNKTIPKILTVTQISLITYILGGEKPSSTVYNFLKNIIGISRTPATATNYLYTKLYNSKINREPLNFYWILGMSIKAYNYFIDGNPGVKFYRFSIDKELPKVKNT